MRAQAQRAPEQKNQFTVVLYGADSAADLLAAVHAVDEALGGAAAGHEVLAVTRPGTDPARVLEEQQARNGRIRWIGAAGPEELGKLLQLGYSESRLPLVAFVACSVDAACLPYLVPLAAHFPVVSGYRLEGRGPWRRRLGSWGYNVLSRLLLGTRARDCGSGLLVFQRSTLAGLLPETAGPFADAEVLARAARAGVPAVEVPVRHTRAAGNGGGPRWRDLPRKLGPFLSFWWSRTVFGGAPPAPARKTSWVFGLLLMLVAALLLFSELNQPLLDPDEGRQAEIAREMLHHDDYLTPHMLGLPYYEKPPLQYWLTAVSYAVFGVRPWAARLVPALAAWLTVLLTYLWGRRNLGARPALLGCLGLCLSLGFLTLGRTVVLDSLLTLCVTASWYAAHTAVVGQGFRKKWWVASALACGLGILAKGPVAVILLAAPVGLFQYLAKSARPRLLPWVAFFGIAGAVAAPWYLAMALTQSGYVTQFLWRANVLRFLEPFDHQQPWWYYLPVLFVGTLPWSLLWAWLAYFMASRSRRLLALRLPALGFCTLAVVCCVVFFSASGCKSPLYVAPALPPLALMHGVCLDAILFRRAGRRDRFLSYARQVLPRRATFVVLVLSAVCYLATGLLGWETWPVVLLELGLTAVALAAWYRFGTQASPRLAWSMCAAATVAMVVISARDLIGGFAARHTVQTIAKIARHWPGAAGYPVISYARQWPSASFYLQRDSVVVFAREQLPLLVKYLKKTPRTLVLVESGEPLQELLAALPATLDIRVNLPRREGQAALVAVRRTSATHVARRH
jgi:4-amino-4-deoxy-L-arabinose transferase-like glycosyltransferase